VRRTAWALAAALGLFGASGTPRGALPRSALAARDDAGRWVRVWSSDSAPNVWRDTTLGALARWRAGAPGVEWAELTLAGSGEAWRTRLVVARVDPARVRLDLDTAFTAAHDPAWTLGRAPDDAALAVNAGQFAASMPWGWVVLDGRRWLGAQPGPLSAALVEDASGALRWVRGGDVARAASDSLGSTPRWAFQSYPALLEGDTVPAPLRAPGRGVSVTHRDARAALCLDHTGRLVVALTRFDAVGEWLGAVPFGLTAPEMAAVMGSLGCRDAMLLDGGISARLLVRDASGQAHRWEGMRPVPLALVATVARPERNDNQQPSTTIQGIAVP